jgi:peptidoglycan hydrolase-like protein with peptidoglycan-binding domain
MHIAGKFGWMGVAFIILTTGTFVQGLPRGAAGSDSNKEEVEGFVVKNEIRKIQETLRIGGNYQGKIDGVFGLRTRASIRAYQKAENLPITGQVDVRTAGALGVRPESQWENPPSTGQEVSYTHKPSAGIKRARGAPKTASTAGEDNRGAGIHQPPAENHLHDH